MRRIALAGAVGLIALSMSAVTVDASSSVARLRGFSCQRAVHPVARSVSVTAVMRPVKGTTKMALRFELLTRTKSGGAWSAVTGGDLSTWVSPSNPTLGQRAGDEWIFNKSVFPLAAPAAYRYKVSFRWTGSHGHTLGTAVRWSATCNQPELRPDLDVSSIDVQPISGKPNLSRYVATIANDGATAAKSFRVQFAPGGGQQPKYRSVFVLRAHATTTETFVGPACSTTAPSTVTVDPDGVVDDFNRANNTLTAVCSSSAGQP